MMLPIAGLLSLMLCQAEPPPEEANADPRTILPTRPDHGLSLDASAHGQGGAVAFVVQADIDRHRLRVGEALTLTLTIHATGEVYKPPQAPKLALQPQAAFADFAIEPQKPIPPPWWAGNTWTFVYKLRPKSINIKEVPPIVLMYWDPVVQSDVAYLTWPIVETNALPLEVLPRPVLPVPLVVPAGTDRFASGPGLLAREQAWQPPSLAMLALLILFPPQLCVILYAIWKRCYPDAVTAARRRQTRAARLALRELAAGRQLPPAQQAERAAVAVARYLQARLDVTLAEPTPTETTRFLGQAGLQGSAVRQTVAFLRACDAARFGGVSSGRLPDDGSAVVHLLEAQKWAPSSS